MIDVEISVVIPVYNTGKFLAECLDSVLSQTFQNLEVICVNDGSTDNSEEILAQYSQKDNRIKVINQKNQGVVTARNNGIS
ncbi:MAG: glycosyltransferase [Alphaproteobacteria bacterium]|nr:glycosyltransferase [Alphaproteobacteria bacterium]